MASVMNPLAHYPLNHASKPNPTPKYNQLCTKVLLLHRNLHLELHALRLRDAPPEYQTDSPENDEANKTRNQKKREARRAFQWAMDLPNFSTTQIKRIIKVASLQPEILDAISLVKRLGRDVREAKRRQFNLIGKMLREVEPDLMNSLLQATIEGDKAKFQKLFGVGSWDIKEDEDDAHDIESEDDEDDSQNHNDMVERWYDGLINKDIDVTNEVYSLHNVEFDRQELRRLVRRVQSVQGNQINSEEKVEEAEAKLLHAKSSLTSFIRNIAKQIPDQ